MKISYNWLQTYFKEKLPAPEKLAELLTFHVFEIESLEKVGGDTVLDVKVLPDRANYALSHRGIAREISYITGAEIKPERIAIPKLNSNESKILELDIHDKHCRRDGTLVVLNIQNKESPQWLKEKLQTLGQRSISFIVDITNYVMLDMGQPLHAFDLDKLTKKNGKVKIVLKPAHQDEKIKILGGKELALEKGTLIFADGNNTDLPLDVAGIKGGAVAEIDATTKNIVVLSANFDPTYIRKTSVNVGIRTDASKRSENGIPLELTMDGLLNLAELIKAESPQAEFEGLVDYYPHQTKLHTIECSVGHIIERLGISISVKDIEGIFSRLDFIFIKHGETYTLTPPYYRLDMNICEDLIEEIGRIYGYEKIPLEQLHVPHTPASINKHFYYEQKIHDVLVAEGFSEVYTYSLTNKGEVEILNPLASDKNMLRAGLVTGVNNVLSHNVRNADLLGLDQIRIFELGTVFHHDKEYTELALGVENVKKLKQKTGEVIRTTLQKIGQALDADTTNTVKDDVSLYTLNFDELIKKLPEPKQSENYPLSPARTYKPFSIYPFIVRDIAVFVPQDVPKESVEEVIKLNTSNRIDKDAPIASLVNLKLFDEFQKDGKKSFAFRLVFQAIDRTLTDDEINKIMEKITEKMNSKKDWQVR
jgi:phenylalanyl-tRNA synthetase beta chain